MKEKYIKPATKIRKVELGGMVNATYYGGAKASTADINDAPDDNSNDSSWEKNW